MKRINYSLIFIAIFTLIYGFSGSYMEADAKVKTTKMLYAKIKYDGHYIKDIKIYEGEKIQLIVEGIYATEISNLEQVKTLNANWSSSDDSVATITKTGIVQANGFGKCMIKAKGNGFDLSCNIIVLEKKKEITLIEGKTKQLELSNADQNIIWSSSNKKIATIDSSGLVKAISEGNVNICGKTGSRKYTFYVTVKSIEETMYLYEINNDTVSITGLKDKSIKELNIPSHIQGKTVTSISSDAFRNNKTITKVVIPDTVIEIDDEAFYGCKNISKMILSNNIKTIGSRAFTVCGMKEIIIPGSLRNWGEEVFAYCNNLTNVIINEGVTTIGANAFTTCEKLVDVTIPNTVRDMQVGAFDYCYSLKYVHLSNDIKRDFTNGFTYCPVRTISGAYLSDCISILTEKEKEILTAALKVIDENIKPEYTNEEKIRSIHNWIVSNTSYDYENYLKGIVINDNYWEYGVLINHTAVCDGYSSAFLMFMNILKIDCIQVIGEITDIASNRNLGHSWNMVKINNKWYHIDCTWDDPVPDGGANSLRYDYFLIDDDTISKDHSWETWWDLSGKVEYPEANEIYIFNN